MFRKLVVPLDTSPLSEQAAAKAAAIARATHGTVHLVHVFEPSLPAFEGGADIGEPIIATERARFERHLHRTAEALSKRLGRKCQVAMLAGVPAAAIATYARRERADLVVMSTHGRTGMSRAWFGSVADALAHQSPLPVLMVRPEEGEEPSQRKASDAAFSRILVALDGSDPAEGILPCVLSLGTAASAEHLLGEVVNPVPLSVIDYPDSGVVTAVAVDVEATEELVASARRYLAGIARRLEREGVLKVDTKVLIAQNAGPAIVELARSYGADLVAMTSHGRGASRLLVGSVADKILRGTHCSILLRRTAVPETAEGSVPSRRAARTKRAIASKRGS